jgi:uncharacterized protein (TIGR02996 family)
MIDPETQSAFLRSILEQPEDDSPRLIYADWLDEEGDADRAEFIRAQIRLHTLSVDDPAHAKLVERVQSLQQEHGMEWIRQLPAIPGIHWEIFDRGFISTARFDTPGLYFSHARQVFEAAPISELRLHTFYWDSAERLAQSSYLKQIRILDLEDGNRIGIKGVEALADSPHLNRLRELKLQGNALGSSAVRALANCPALSELRLLDLGRNDLYDEGAKALAQSHYLSNLNQLSLGWTRMTEAGLESLAATKHLTQLKFLYLSGNQLGDDGMKALGGSKAFSNLRALYLVGCGIGNEGAAFLAESPHLENLNWLYLRQNRIGSEGGEAIARSPYLDNIGELVLGENPLSDETVVHLHNRFGNKVTSY